MADDRHSYKGTTITLELHEDDVSGGVLSDPLEVIIFQDKEVCYSTSVIDLIPGGWSITLNTDQIKYSGDYIDRWVLSSDDWIEKSLSVSEATSVNIVGVNNYTYYSKDLIFEVQPDGDLYRLYNDSSIVAKIEAVCMTVQGSLFNEPGHGTGLYRFLFSMSPNAADMIRLEVETQVQMQVPQIKIKEVKVTPSDYNAYNVIVNFFNVSSSSPNELLSMTNLVSVEQVTGG